MIRDWCYIFLNPILLYERSNLVEGLLEYMLDCHELVEVKEAPGNSDGEFESHYYISLKFDNGTELCMWHVNRFYSWLSCGCISGPNFNYRWDKVKVSRRVKWRIYKAIMEKYRSEGKKQELVSEKRLECLHRESITEFRAALQKTSYAGSVAR